MRTIALPVAPPLLLSAVVGLSTCGGDDGVETPTGAGIARSHLDRDTSPEVSLEDRETFAAGNRDFAADLTDALRGESDGNLFLSPYGISTALGMTYAGAEGETESQMREALGFDLPEQRLHPAFNWTDLEQTLFLGRVVDP